MPRVGFEHATPVFEQAKTIHALDGADTVIGVDMRIYLRANHDEIRNKLISTKDRKFFRT
jgi:hypothetical protein